MQNNKRKTKKINKIEEGGVIVKWGVNWVQINGLLAEPITGFCTAREIQKQGVHSAKLEMGRLSPMLQQTFQIGGAEMKLRGKLANGANGLGQAQSYFPH